MSLHPTAIVDPRAALADDVEVGPWAQIGAGAQLGRGCRVGAAVVIEAGAHLGPGVEIGHHSVIHGGTRLGAGCQVFPQVVLGAAPQDRKFNGEPSWLEIGPGTVFREFSTAHRGTGEGGLTRIGAGCLFMIGSHVAHDCVVEDNVVMANHVALAGHVQVGAGAVLGGLSAVHQHCRIGRLAMIGGGAMVAADVPPFSLAQGDRARLLGINQVGLQRAGWSPSAIRVLAAAWRAAFSLPRRDEDSLMATFSEVPELHELLGFRRSSARGLCRIGGATGAAS